VVRCWGFNDYGQLGDGTSTSTSTPSTVCGSGTGATCLPFTGVRALDLGQLYSCALKVDGSEWCWGSNHSLQLGPAAPTAQNSPRPVRVALPAGTPTALGLGWATGCTVVGGRAQCWGQNTAPSSARGLLGRGPLASDASAEPAPVCRSMTETGACTPLEDVREVAFSVHAGCARAGDAVYCWGYDAYRGLAHAEPVPDDTSTVALLADAPTPLGEVPLLTRDVQGLAAGFEHFCALRKGGLVCWGNNSRGALGTNDTREANADIRPQRPVW
jgi:hypothetical protein